MFPKIEQVVLLLACLRTAFAVTPNDTINDSWTSSVNPGCNLTQCSDPGVNLIHVQSKTSNSSTHFLWSSYGNNSVPGFFVVSSDNVNEGPKINWDQFLNTSDQTTSTITIDEVTNAIGIAVTKVYFWDDASNDGKLDVLSNTTDTKPWSELVLDNVRPTLKTTDTGSSASFVFKQPATDLEVSINVFASPQSGRYSILPRLVYTPQSFHVEITVSGAVNDSIVNQRVGAEFAVFQSYGSFQPNRVDSIDDEYSPGVFSKVVAQLEGENRTSYLLWRPIGYSANDRIVSHTVDGTLLLNSNATDVNHVPIGQFRPRRFLLRSANQCFFLRHYIWFSWRKLLQRF
ncbi:Glycosylated lysosomal membrane protein B [Halotydeus destructor]|nr:Glycosylated lysosomal membrane protein B [Halotydeus destructor]